MERNEVSDTWILVSRRDMVRKRLDNAGMYVLIDCLSFPGQVLTSDRDRTERPDICIGTDDFHTPEYLVKMISHNCEKH